MSQDLPSKAAVVARTLRDPRCKAGWELEVGATAVGEILARWVETPRDGRLTEAEINVLRLIAEGRRNGELAASLSMSAATVNRLVKSAIEKLGAASRSQTTAVAVRRGLI